MAEEAGMDLDLNQLKRFEPVLEAIKNAGADTVVPLKRFNVYYLGALGKMFDEGGRGPVKWAPLSEVAKVMRGYRGRGSTRTFTKPGRQRARVLQDTGELKAGPRAEIIRLGGSQFSHTWNPVPHAAFHQYGGKLEIPEKIIVPTKKKALRFMVMESLGSRSGASMGKWVFAKKVVQPARVVDVPARPHMNIFEEDENKALTLLEEHAISVAGKFGGAAP